jgi:hypothetical protein
MFRKLAILAILASLAQFTPVYPAEARDGSKSVTDGLGGGQAKGDSRNTSKKEAEAAFDQQYNEWLDAYDRYLADPEDEQAIKDFTDGATIGIELNEAKQNKEVSKDYELPNGGAELDVFN